MKEVKESKRNKPRQFIPAGIDRNDNPTEAKAIFHEKEFNKPRFTDLKSIWNNINTSPKPNSKRQQKLRAERGELLPA